MTNYVSIYLKAQMYDNVSYHGSLFFFLLFLDKYVETRSLKHDAWKLVFLHKKNRIMKKQQEL